MPRPTKIVWFALILSLSTLLLFYYFVDIQLLIPHSSVVSLDELPHTTPEHTPADSTEPELAKVLLVSAFFPLSKSKDVLAEHKKSLSFLLSPIKTDIYFFTSPEMEEQVRDLRERLPITVNTTFTSPFETPPMYSYREAYTEMHKKDREKDMHSPKSYAVSNNKPFFLAQGLQNARLAGKHYDYAFWIDPSSFTRVHAYTAWPDNSRLDAIWQHGSEVTGTDKNDLLFFPMFNPPHSTMQYWTEPMGPIANDFIDSSFFGGNPSAILWYSNVFYAYHNEYISPSRGPHFVGKDQAVINAIMLLFPERFITVWAKDPKPHLLEETAPVNHLPSELPLGTCGDSSTFYQFFLASPSSRAAMIKNFKSDTSIWHNWPWKWTPSEWFHQRNDCRLPKTQGMMDVLKGIFGQDWHSPGRSVNF